ESDIQLRLMSVERYIQCAPDGSFDLVFLDPPFPRHKKKELIEKIGATSLVKEGGLLMIHYPSEDNLDQEKFEAFDLRDERKYGRSIVLFYRKKAPIEENQAAVR
ncbi:MAG: RsmD family RNA methyltransferase, partial [Spirochaetia bacterium]|nr:RsmD family RNA methyltransferase [Spirochaetia bacterium]